MDIFIKEYNAKVKTLEFVKKAYGKCNFSSVDSSYQYLLGYANALYDCGLITQAGSYRFNTTFRSTNFPNTTRSFSTVFTFSAN